MALVEALEALVVVSVALVDTTVVLDDAWTLTVLAAPAIVGAADTHELFPMHFWLGVQGEFAARFKSSYKWLDRSCVLEKIKTRKTKQQAPDRYSLVLAIEPSFKLISCPEVETNYKGPGSHVARQPVRG